MIDAKLKVISNDKIANNIYKMILSTPEKSVLIKPGQFIDISIEGQFLRRPISICD